MEHAAIGGVPQAQYFMGNAYRIRQYRDELWTAYPNTERIDPTESLGIALLKDGLASNGVTVLFAEAVALNETAHDELARLMKPASLNSIRVSWPVLEPPLPMVSSRKRKRWRASMAKASWLRRM